MTEATNGIYTLTQPAILAFPQLFEPKAIKKKGKETGEPKYSALFLFSPDSEDLKALKQLAAKLAREKWPDKPFNLTTQEGVQIPQILFPMKTGEKYNDNRIKAAEREGKTVQPYDFVLGKWVMPSSSKYAPKLAHIENAKMVDIETDLQKAAAKNKFYSGAEVLAQLNLVPYEGVGSDGKPGITAYLNMVLTTNKGARLSGGQSASETFRGYVGSVSGDDPTAPGAGATMDDEIPY